MQKAEGGRPKCEFADEKNRMGSASPCFSAWHIHAPSFTTGNCATPADGKAKGRRQQARPDHSLQWLRGMCRLTIASDAVTMAIAAAHTRK
jgi:hypothetical protein